MQTMPKENAFRPINLLDVKASHEGKAGEGDEESKTEVTRSGPKRRLTALPAFRGDLAGERALATSSDARVPEEKQIPPHYRHIWNLIKANKYDAVENILKEGCPVDGKSSFRTFWRFRFKNFSLSQYEH